MWKWYVDEVLIKINGERQYGISQWPNLFLQRLTALPLGNGGFSAEARRFRMRLTAPPFYKRVNR